MDGDRSAHRILAHVAYELGENFWERLRLPLAPTPAARPAPMRVLNAVCVWLGPDQRKEAEAALWFSRRHAIDSASVALRAYAAQCAAAADAPTITDCLDEFLSEKRASGQSGARICNLRAQFRGFLERFGDRRPADATSTAIQDYLVSESTAPATWHRAKGLSTFFDWAIRRRYAVTNPIPLKLKHRPIRSRARLIFTPRQARYILRETRNTDQIGYWVLSFFAGLRTSEIQRLQRHSFPWRFVRFRTNELVVPTTIPGKIDRIIKMQPVLRDWLEWVRLRRAAFYPANFWEKKFPRMWQAALRKFPDNRTAKSGYRPAPSPSRVLGIARATHLAYRLATPSVNLDLVAYEMGDVMKRVRQHRDPLITPRRARDFFALTPTKI